MHHCQSTCDLGNIACELSISFATGLAESLKFMYETLNKPVHCAILLGEMAQEELAGLELLSGRDILLLTQRVLDCLVPGPFILQIFLLGLPPEKPYSPGFLGDFREFCKFYIIFISINYGCTFLV